METEELKFLLALEPTWTVSLNGLEFQTMASSEILIDARTIRLGKWTRRIEEISWLRPNVVRVSGSQKVRSKRDSFTLYAGEQLPSAADLRRRRRTFQAQLSKALAEHFGTRSVQRQTLSSDRAHSIGGAYPRFLVGNRAVIAVDPDESQAVVNSVMRSAILWSALIRKHVTVVAPKYRAYTIANRLREMPALRGSFEWCEWDGERLAPLEYASDGVWTEVHEFNPPDAAAEVSRILSGVSLPLNVFQNIAGRAVSIRFRGLEVAQIRDGCTSYPFGQPLQTVVEELASLRRHGSVHPLARAHQEQWLESNIIGEIGRLLPSINPDHVYPQVPSFVGEERNIIDLLAITKDGRLVVMEIKASSDPDLPFQALDYWIAVEQHRKAGDFQTKGYFKGITIKDQPALLVLVAPLLTFHRTLDQLLSVIPETVPILRIGLNQTWKKEIKILRRHGIVS